MRAFDLLRTLKALGCCPCFDDKGRPTSNSQLLRWLQQGAVHINGARADEATVYDEINSLVFFPNNPKKRITVW